MNSRKRGRKLTKAELRALGATPGLMARHAPPTLPQAKLGGTWDP
jgi:hypothetical protein